MLCVFNKGVVNPPKELQSPEAAAVLPVNLKRAGEALQDFLSSNPTNSFHLHFGDNGFLAASSSQSSTAAPRQTSRRKMFCGVEDVYCVFVGSLDNLSALNRQYGLSKSSNEAVFAIEAYRTLRDRRPLPAHRVLQDLDGSFAFVVYDHKSGTAFAAVGGNGEVNLLWGITGDGCVMISDDTSLIKASCGKSFAPFPAGCMYHTESGLISFEHPRNAMKAMPRVDSKGAICGSNFAVDDSCATVKSMPRVGSEANWANWS
ncbi:hypothetical protein M569_00887 [Genlisea aurea]|uniref:DUF3700 domain-containing protein n=1 Tax=Genlisea aurea TaxID=192259 RepID=S8ED47_9LAMI|nr:hypothetical protein M569_00887 [Genlisea aurea]